MFKKTIIGLSVVAVGVVGFKNPEKVKGVLKFIKNKGAGLGKTIKGLKKAKEVKEG